MWRAAASRLLLRRSPPANYTAASLQCHHHLRLFTTSPPPSPEAAVTAAEARRLLRFVEVEALKRRLGREEEEVIGYGELLEACVAAGAARTKIEAESLARALDESGVVLLFRGKVYLHPEKPVPWRNPSQSSIRLVVEETLANN